MTASEAIDEVVHLKGLFPKLMAGEEAFFQDRFEGLPRDPVRRSIDRYASRHSGTVEREGFNEILASELRRDQPVANHQLERAQVDEHWRQVDAAVRAITPADLARLQNEAIATLPDRLRESARRRGLDSPLVKALIYKVITAPHG